MARGRRRKETGRGVGPREVTDDSVTANDFDWKTVIRNGKKYIVGTRKG